MIRQTDWSGVTTRNIRSRKWALIAAALLYRKKLRRV